jgi:hypothetical protein
MLRGAPVNYALAGDWSSKMSLGQGADYFKYHQGQHGGEAPLSSLGQSFLTADMAGPARVGPLNQALNEIAGMKDQTGGKRKRKHSKRKHSKRKHSKRKQSKCKQSKRRSQRKRGGSLEYARYGSPSMLLDSAGYARAGLSPEWKSNVEFTNASIRNQL